MTRLTDPELLWIWEYAQGLSTNARAQLLAGWAAQADTDDLTIGQRDRLLLQARIAWLGNRMDCTVTCPDCAETLELNLDAGALLVDETSGEDTFSTEIDGQEVHARLPRLRDLAALDPSDPLESLTRACIRAPTRLSPAALEAIDDRMSELDPQAALTIDVGCEPCGRRFAAAFDIGTVLWSEINGMARSLMSELASLATIYGWSEADSLAVSPARRRYYLEAAAA